MNSRLALLLVIFLLSGCGHFLPPLKDVQSQQVSSLRDDEAFVLAVDDFRASLQSSSLQDFVQNYPASQLVFAAKTLIECADLLEQNSKDATDRKNNDRQLSQKVAALTAENSKLEQQLEQLKLLLIEMEKRP
ncbi:MAG: hypothetical protein C0622_00580 [Desulfuromonas sp.]|nr:MAG: hypothetical protein C0622_00580 [Desulfuromonas sp.]